MLVVDQFEEVFTLTDGRAASGSTFLESLRAAAAEPESRLRVDRDPPGGLLRPPADLPAVRRAARGADRGESRRCPPRSSSGRSWAGRTVGVRRRARAGRRDDRRRRPSSGRAPAPAVRAHRALRAAGRRTADRSPRTGEIGGVSGALSRAGRAAIFEALTEAGPTCDEQVFLRLVTLGEGAAGHATPRRRAELRRPRRDPEAIDAVIETFGRHRLLSFDRDPPPGSRRSRSPTRRCCAPGDGSAPGSTTPGTTSDHERGLRRLPPSGGARTAMRASSSAVRSSSSRHGPRPRPWRWARPTRVPEGERRSTRREREERERRASREVRIERRSARRLRGLVAVLAVAALVAGSLTVVANQPERARPGREARIATARELGGRCGREPRRRPRAQRPASRSRPSSDPFGGRVRAPGSRGGAAPGHHGVPACDSRSRGGGSSTGARGRLRDRGSGGIGRDRHQGRANRERGPSFQGHDGDVNDVAFSADGSTLASTGDDGTLKVWDPATGGLWTFAGGRGVGPVVQRRRVAGRRRLGRREGPRPGSVHRPGGTTISWHRASPNRHRPQSRREAPGRGVLNPDDGDVAPC